MEQGVCGWQRLLRCNDEFWSGIHYEQGLVVVAESRGGLADVGLEPREGVIPLKEFVY